MTQQEARNLAMGVRDTLPMGLRQRLKAIHVMPRVHNGHLTVRVFMVNQSVEDPPEFIFTPEEL